MKHLSEVYLAPRTTDNVSWLQRGTETEAPELFQLRFSLLNNFTKVSQRENGESKVLVLWALEPTLWAEWRFRPSDNAGGAFPTTRV